MSEGGCARRMAGWAHYELSVTSASRDRVSACRECERRKRAARDGLYTGWLLPAPQCADSDIHASVLEPPLSSPPKPPLAGIRAPINRTLHSVAHSNRTVFTVFPLNLCIARPQQQHYHPSPGTRKRRDALHKQRTARRQSSLCCSTPSLSPPLTPTPQPLLRYSRQTNSRHVSTTPAGPSSLFSPASLPLLLHHPPRRYHQSPSLVRCR